MKYNPPPGWPLPPPGWSPPPDWQPDSSWPAPPPGWQLWIEETPPPKQRMKKIIRIILVMAMLLELIVAIGHFGDLDKQSTGEWILLEFVVLVILAGTVFLYRVVGARWEIMPPWQKLLVGAPVVASLVYIGPALAFAALVFVAIAFVIWLFKEGLMGD